MQKGGWIQRFYFVTRSLSVSCMVFLPGRTFAPGDDLGDKRWAAWAKAWDSRPAELPIFSERTGAVAFCARSWGRLFLVQTADINHPYDKDYPRRFRWARPPKFGVVAAYDCTLVVPRLLWVVHLIGGAKGNPRHRIPRGLFSYLLSSGYYPQRDLGFNNALHDRALRNCMVMYVQDPWADEVRVSMLDRSGRVVVTRTAHTASGRWVIPQRRLPSIPEEWSKSCSSGHL